MIYLVCILISYLLGKGVLQAFYGSSIKRRKRKHLTQDFTGADSVLTGGMIIIGLAEAAHLGTVVLGLSFSDCVKLFLTGCLLLLIVAVILIGLEHRRKKMDKSLLREVEREKIRKAMTVSPYGTQEKVIFAVFFGMALIQLLFLVSGQKVYPAGDMTAETVNSILTTNAIYQVNPMTGQPYTLGMPMRLKILCLPTLYATFCELFGMTAAEVVWTAVPILTLLGCYLAYYTVARALFFSEPGKQGIFMIAVALMLWVGDYLYGMDGFGVQYAGFRGVSIRMAILLPYTFGLILRKKWKLLPLCILAEACIVWTLYGMGACLFVTVAMLLLGMIRNDLTDIKNSVQSGAGWQGGEENDL